LAAASEGTQRRELFREAFFLAGKIENPDLQLESLLENLKALGEASLLQGEDLELVLALAGELDCLHCRAVYLAAASQYVPMAEGAKLLNEAPALTAKISHEGDREVAEYRIASYRRKPVSFQPAREIPPIGFERDPKWADLVEQDVRNAKTAEARARALLNLAGGLSEPRKSETLRLAIESAVEAARAEKQQQNKRNSFYWRKRKRTKPLIGEPKLVPLTRYAPIPGKKLDEKLDYLRAFLRTPYPLPAGLRESDLSLHGTLPWQAGWWMPSIQGPVFVNFDRLSWAKELMELQRGKGENERHELMKLAEAVAEGITEQDTRILAKALFAVERGERSELQAALEAVRSIRFEPYRADGLILLYSAVEPNQRGQILTEAFMAALRIAGGEDGRSLYLRHLAPAAARLPRSTLYALWRDMAAQLNGDWDDRWPPLDQCLEEIFPVVAALAGEDRANKTIAEAANAAS
jgi:hypothetical protein